MSTSEGSASRIGSLKETGAGAPGFMSGCCANPRVPDPVNQVHPSREEEAGSRLGSFSVESPENSLVSRIGPWVNTLKSASSA